MYLKQPSKGFSLIELSLVLLILALLAGGLLTPLGAQREISRLREARSGLLSIREALLGYAAIHGTLPCPDTDTNPTLVGYGVEEITCITSSGSEGFLPFKTLGLPEADPWGGPRLTAGEPPGHRWRYRVDRNFADGPHPIELSTSFGTDALQVVDREGLPLSTSTEKPIAIFFSVGPNGHPDGENSGFEASNGRYQAGLPDSLFDDQLEWLSRPLLINRLVSAGRPL